MLAVFSRKGKFSPAPLKESNAPLDNPGRGWYHIYPFSLASGRNPADEVFLQPEERLALVRIGLGNYRAKELNFSALARVSAILGLFRQAGKMIILRFAYDDEGKGPEREPDSAALIRRHMEQLGRVLQEFSRDILVIQGVFVGRWGEMHGSRFLAGNAIPQLLSALFQATEGKCPLAVRTPAQWRAAAAALPPALTARLALFNDGIFGSLTDLGTYGSSSRQEAGETAPWSREEELAWQDSTLAGVPNGGEALAGEKPPSSGEAVKTLEKMHLTYLNSSYQPELLAGWKREALAGPGCWAGCSGFDYIGRRLGYRLTARRAEVKGKKLLVQVENLGFAAPCLSIQWAVSLKGPEGRELGRVGLTGGEDGLWPGRAAVLEALLPQEALSSGAAIYLEAEAEGRLVYLANQGAEASLCLGRFGEPR